MLFAAHADALYETLIEAELDPFDNVFAHSRLSASEAVLAEYERRFSGVTERHLLMSFLNSLGSRLKVSRAQLSSVSEIGAHYLASAHAGGKILVTGTQTVRTQQDDMVLDAHGIRAGLLSTVFEPSCQIGYAPFERFQLREGHNLTPEIIGRFFRGARNATFYDKYINRSALSLIGTLAKLMPSSAKILIITSGEALGATAIRNEIAPLVSQRVSVAIADRPTRERFHDRHIFVDNFYQMHIGRGLDIFGSEPRWRNLNGEICVYDCEFGEDVVFSFVRDGGSSRGPLRLKAAIVA